MRPPNGTVISHVRSPYDPIKAHEYYMRTRVLKGRKRAPRYAVKTASGKTVELTAKELNEQKAYAAQRVAAILKKLDELNAKLTKAMGVAKEKKTKSKREASKEPSVSDKREAAKESRQYKDKHKQKIATQRKRVAATKPKTTTTKSDKKDPVTQLEAKIEKIRTTLKAAIARQRALAGATQTR